MQTISLYLVKISVNVINYCTIITWYKIVIVIVFVMDKVPRKITKKVKKAELPFLHPAGHLMLIDICIKFPEYSLSGFQVLERTRFL